MKTIIKQFLCRVKTGETQTSYDFKAVVKVSYDSPYRIEVITRQYKNGRITAYCKNEFYFDSSDKMIQEFKNHYDLCKNNVFTEYIEILK